MSNEKIIAAVDLGSNSFHMIVAEYSDRNLQIVDRLKETVRLGAGLDRKRRIDKETMSRALACLGRFGQRLRGAARSNVRAVGTNALRIARNSNEFRAEAARALGYPIEIISGHEEARLIYVGVSSEYLDPGCRLVVDIGGGSTEIIVGEGRELLTAHSLYMGCVSFTERFFKGGDMTPCAFERAELAARLEVRNVARSFARRDFESVIGSSGTVQAIERVQAELGWAASGIDRLRLQEVKQHLLSRAKVESLELESIKSSRAQVLAAGVAILVAVFDVLGIERMRVAQNALREGVLTDLLGRRMHEDARDASVRRVMTRAGIDTDHAARVETTALALYEQVQGEWNLDRVEVRRVLGWAARLHEAGLWISYGGYHKHGAYLLANASLDGFSADGQRVLAAIVRGHRRKFSAGYFSDLLPHWRETALRLCVILRLAVLLHRGRGTLEGDRPALVVRNGALILLATRAWLRAHPLTAADLEVETRYLKAGGITFQVSVEGGTGA